MEDNDSLQEALREEVRTLRARVEDLTEDSARYRALLSNLNSTVVETDAQGRCTYVSDQVQELLGQPPEQVVGSSFSDWIHPEDMARTVENLSKLVSGEPVFNAEYRVRHADGHYVPVFATGRRVQVGDEERLLAVVHDDTERQQQQQELLKARKLESIGLLAGGIAHDFNNVLAAILGNLNVARVRCDDDDVAQPLLHDAEKATLRARRLTQQLLTFARGGAPVRKATGVSALLSAAMDSGLPEGATPPTVALPADLWDADVDPDQAQHALEQLLRNGLAAGGPDAPLNIRANNVQIAHGQGALKPGRYVQIAFEDRGPPIPPEQHADVFDPYFDNRNTDSALALATAFSIASRHGGTITVDSGPEGGSVFALYLPAALTPTQEHALQKTRIAGEGRRVLVMDDERIVRSVTRRMLEALGFEVHVAADGEEALASYTAAREAETPFHAVLLDLTVPSGLGGKDTMVRLLELDPDVKAVAVSGYSDDAVMANYADHGFRAMLPKPFQLAELSAALHRAL